MILLLIGTIVTFPMMVLFFGMWIVSSLYRPLKYACWMSMLLHHQASATKLKLFINTVVFLLFCKDKKFTKPKTNMQNDVQQLIEQQSKQQQQQQQQAETKPSTATGSNSATTTTGTGGANEKTPPSVKDSTGTTSSTDKSDAVGGSSSSSENNTKKDHNATKEEDKGATSKTLPTTISPALATLPIIESSKVYVSATAEAETEQDRSTHPSTTSNTKDESQSTASGTTAAAAPAPATTIPTADVDPAASSSTTTTTTDADSNNNTNATTAAATGKDNNNNSRSSSITVSTKTKTIIFLRHGESTWNDTFNKGKDRSTVQFVLGFLPNLIKAVFVELYFMVTGQETESWFYDAPLSPHGIQQSEAVRTYLQRNSNNNQRGMTKESQYLQLMVNGNQKAHLLCSNLRRAVSTMAIVLQDRLLQSNDADDPIKAPTTTTTTTTPKKNTTSHNNNNNNNNNNHHPGERITILTCLQEISNNPDALAITPASAKIMKSSFTDPPGIKSYLPEWVNTIYHDGNKPVHSNGLLRLTEFVQILFDEKKKLPEDIVNSDCFVVAGHSLWFKSFFQLYLPDDCDHISKRKKLVNCGCAGFKLHQHTIVRTTTTADGNDKSITTTVYRIDPASLKVIYGGFK